MSSGPLPVITWSEKLAQRPIPRVVGWEIGIGWGGRRGPSRSLAASRPAVRRRVAAHSVRTGHVELAFTTTAYGAQGETVRSAHLMSSAALSAACLGLRSARSRLKTSTH
jgi:hypothetical protein